MRRLGHLATRGIAWAMGKAIILLAHVVTAPRAVWQGVAPVEERARIYFANHTSNADFVLVWSVLPNAIRARTRPVAAADYWGRTPLRRFLIRHVFRGVLVERCGMRDPQIACNAMADAVREGSSLIVFPEGTRNDGTRPLGPLKPGLYHLGRALPGVELVPVWIDNLNRVLPKGSVVPVPLLCSVHFGAPIRPRAGEGKEAFLVRAAEALVALRPAGDGAGGCDSDLPPTAEADNDTNTDSRAMTALNDRRIAA
ncbi:MAG: lysophospholipid acyltransferase family protein [Pseudomonadota bacterium]